jgi:hypothetical protein
LNIKLHRVIFTVIHSDSTLSPCTNSAFNLLLIPISLRNDFE